MKYYCLDPNSGEALRRPDGEWLAQIAAALPNVPGHGAQAEQVERLFAIPAHAVVNAPVNPRHKNEVPVAGEIELDDHGYPRASWRLMPDYRGQEWYDPNGSAVVVIKLGDPSQDGLRTRPTIKSLQVQKSAPTKSPGFMTRLFGRGRA